MNETINISYIDQTEKYIEDHKNEMPKQVYEFYKTGLKRRKKVY